MTIDLRQLRYLVAVGDAGSIGAAARALHIAQPALSRTIRGLEELVGAELVVRSPRGAQLTPAGEQLAADARDLIAGAESAMSRARRVASGAVGFLRIGINETYAWHGVVPEALRRFREGYPDVSLSITPARSLEQLALLRAGDLDAGFAFNRDRDDPLLTGETVVRDAVRLAIREDAPLARRRRVSMADLGQTEFVWFPRDSSPAYFDRLARACARGGLRPRVAQEAGSSSAMLVLVANGLGAAFVPEASRHRMPSGVTLVTVADLDLQLELELVWRAGDPSPTLRRFREMLSSRTDARAGRKRGR